MRQVRRRRHDDDVSTASCRRGPVGRRVRRRVTLTSRGPPGSVMSYVSRSTAVAPVPEDFVVVVGVARLHAVVRRPVHQRICTLVTSVNDAVDPVCVCQQVNCKSKCVLCVFMLFCLISLH